MTSKEIQAPNTTGISSAAKYENKTDDVLMTDADGYVTFVYGLDRTSDSVGAVDSTRAEYIASYKLTANVVGTDIKNTFDLKFGAVSLGTSADSSGNTAVSVMNNKDGSIPNLEVSTNTTGNGEATTHDGNGKTSEYVTSQQVSADGTDHSVVLSTCAYLVMPGTETETTPGDIVKEINYSSGKYGVYADTSWQGVIDEAKASELQYATVNFSSLKLSKYTTLDVQAYATSDLTNPWNNAQWISGKTLEGEKNTSNFSVQIPISATSGYLFINVYIHSAGQVNTDMNDGFTIKNVVGVYNKSSKASGSSSEKLDDVTVEWAVNNDATYTSPEKLTADSSVGSGIYSALSEKYGDGYTYEYVVPAFPFTGNAVITVYDANKNAVAYYAVPAKNEEEYVYNGSDWVLSGGYKNTNTIPWSADGMYQITKAEAFDAVGTVTVKDGNAVVDSTKTGVTHLIGTIKSDNANLKLDASNNKVYSSVQWNPIPTIASTERQAGAALVGQTITLTAQLTDRGSNAVTNANEEITFLKDGKEITGTVIGNVTVIKKEGKTNAFGQASLVLTSADPTELTGLSAKLSSDKYSLAYSMSSQSQTVTASVIDLYWLDLNLAFTDSVGGTTTDTSEKPTNEITEGIEPLVNTNWEYGVKVTGTTGNAEFTGALAGYSVQSVSDITIQTKAGAGSEGTVTGASNGKADVTSSKAGITYLVNTIDSTSIGNNVQFTFKNSYTTLTLPNIGTGTLALDKKLTLDINWQTSGITATIIIPSGKTAVSGSAVTAYVKVTDNSGNPISGAAVTMEATNGTLDNATVTTDANGIAAFVLSNGEAGKTSILKATVAGTDNVYSASIKWISDENLTTTTLQIEKAEYDYTTKTVKLTFNTEIYANSVAAKQFKITYDGKEQIVGNVTVSGKVVTLTLPQLASVDKTADFTVGITSATVDSINYTVTSSEGVTLVDVTAQKIEVE